MTNVKLELSYESMDALFVDLLNDNLETILYTDVNFIHPDDYVYNMNLAESIVPLMRYQKDAHEFSIWYADVYLPMLNKYNEKYESLTSEDEGESDDNV